MRFLLLLALAFGSLNVQGQTKRPAPTSERAIITSKRIARQVYDGEHRFLDVALVPVVSGLPDPVLRVVRSELKLKRLLGEFGYKLFRDKGLFDLDYEVTYNRNHILSLILSGRSYYNSFETTATFDLKTGKRIKLSDLFLEDQMEAVASLIDSQLQKEKEEMIRTLHGRGDIEYALNHQGPLRFEMNDFDLETGRGRNFTINASGITFFFHAGFHHVFSWAEPKGHYSIEYSELKRFLKPDTPVSQFLN